MKHNRRQIAKEVYSKEAEGDRILYHPCYSDKEEAMVVAKEIDRIKRQDGCEYDAFAILYRTNAQSRSFEDELRKRAIPYIIYGGLSFYQRKEIKDILAYFRLVVNPDDARPCAASSTIPPAASATRRCSASLTAPRRTA